MDELCGGGNSDDEKIQNTIPPLKHLSKSADSAVSKEIAVDPKTEVNL